MYCAFAIHIHPLTHLKTSWRNSETETLRENATVPRGLSCMLSIIMSEVPDFSSPPPFSAANSDLLCTLASAVTRTDVTNFLLLLTHPYKGCGGAGAKCETDPVCVGARRAPSLSTISCLP